jgi:hypothetical protein
MMIDIPTMHEKYVGPNYLARSFDALEGCFVSGIVYKDNSAIMSHRGSGCFKEMLKGMKNVAEEYHLIDPLKKFICYLNKQDKKALKIPYSQYEDYLNKFKSKMEEEFMGELKIIPYRFKNVVLLDLERNVKIEGLVSYVFD